MIGKLIGAFVGDKLAKQTRGVDGATGAVLGVVATTVLRRLSLPAMLAIGAGGYLAKKFADDAKKADSGTSTKTSGASTTTTANTI